MIGKRILVPLKGCYLNAEGSRASGFKNTMVTGVLRRIDDNGALHLENDAGELTAIVPKDSIGAILTDGCEFYQGPEEDIFSMFEDPDESGH